MLLTRPAKRFFTFGCSFTNYLDWPTWANIVASELQLPFWNYGLGGAGNQYIFNMIMQADAMHQFNSDDVIMICWSNTTREDRYINGVWQCYGNIFNNPAANAVASNRGITPWVRAQKFLAGWGDPEGFLVRDLASIKAAVELIKSRGCQLQQFSMMGFESGGEEVITNAEMNPMLELIYGSYLKEIKPSFFKVLWNNDLSIKEQWNKQRTKNKFSDLHPHPIEHLNYIEQVMDYKFSDRVQQEVADTQQLLEDEMSENKRFYKITVPITHPSQPLRGLYHCTPFF
jgi:hypothetical protein